MRASALAPTRVLRAIDGVRTRRFLATVGPPSEEYVRRMGLRVRRGPFTGMQYIPGLERSSGDLVAKLAGTYECELHEALEEWIAAAHTQVIDVGAAEGYYAVGLAVAMPHVTVHAYDIDATARELCAALARRNDVGERVRVGGACEPATLASFPDRGVALFSDCEGYERTLLDPELAPQLRTWPIIVELHEFIDPSITELIRARFRASHEIDIIEARGRGDEELPELEFMTPAQRAAVLSERRPGRMRWARLRPR
jgi:hypothetical protein